MYKKFNDKNKTLQKNILKYIYLIKTQSLNNLSKILSPLKIKMLTNIIELTIKNEELLRKLS